MKAWGAQPPRLPFGAYGQTKRGGRAHGSANTHLTRNDPTVYAFYSEPRYPLPANPKPSQGIHHINLGLRLKEQMDKLGIECIVRHQDERRDIPREITDYFIQHLDAGK